MKAGRERRIRRSAVGVGKVHAHGDFSPSPSGAMRRSCAEYAYP